MRKVSGCFPVYITYDPFEQGADALVGALAGQRLVFLPHGGEEGVGRYQGFAVAQAIENP